MWTGPLARLSLSSIDVVDKGQDFRSGIWVSTALVPWMKMKTQRVKILNSSENVLKIVIFGLLVGREVGHCFSFSFSLEK